MVRSMRIGSPTAAVRGSASILISIPEGRACGSCERHRGPKARKQKTHPSRDRKGAVVARLQVGSSFGLRQLDRSLTVAARIVFRLKNPTYYLARLARSSKKRIK